jgi:hypothetical protein
MGGMGAMNPATAILGAGFRIAGGFLSADAADDRRERWENFMNSLPTPDAKKEAQAWFDEMNQFYEPARKLSERAQTDEMAQGLRLREMALPGYGQGLRSAMSGVNSMLQGEFTPGELSTWSRVGGASTAGLGFGGSLFGALNTGLYGVRGARGAMAEGIGLLPTLLSATPQLSQSSSTMGLLGNLLTPMQRVDLQMRLRQQRIGMQMTLEEMPTGQDSWAAHLNESGAMLLGGGGGFGGTSANLGLNRAPEAPNGGGYNTNWTMGNTSTAASNYNMQGAIGGASGRLY